jgi:phosphate transport system substrate-binding protein
MLKLNSLLVVALLGASVASASAETVKIAGSGGMIPLVNELAKAYMKKNPKETVEVEQKSLGQGGGLMKLSKGLIDISMAAHTLESNQKSLPVQAYEIATVPGLFAVHNSVSVRALSSQQICDIYSGKIRNWKQVGGKDAPIVALTRPEDESTKKAVREGVACFGALKEGPEAVMVAKSTDNYNQLTSTANSIAMINSVQLADAGGKIAAVKLDGKDVQTLSPTQWPINHRFNLVTGKQPTEATKRFMKFVGSAEGQAVIKREKAFPVPLKF